MSNIKDKTTTFQITGNATQATLLDGKESLTIEQQGLNKVTKVSDIATYVKSTVLTDDDTAFITKTGEVAGAQTQAQSFGSNGIKADVIIESTNNAGVAVETLLLKDGNLTLPEAGNIAAGVTTGTKIGTTNLQKLGLWNTAPDIQPTNAIVAASFVTNASGITDDSATWGGYTIGQVVAALKRIGALA